MRTGEKPEKSRGWTQGEQITNSLQRFETKVWSTHAREKPACTVENFECTVSDFSLTPTKTFHIHIKQIIKKVLMKVLTQQQLRKYSDANPNSVNTDRALTGIHWVYPGKIKHWMDSTKIGTCLKPKGWITKLTFLVSAQHSLQMVINRVAYHEISYFSFPSLLKIHCLNCCKLSWIETFVPDTGWSNILLQSHLSWAYGFALCIFKILFA